MLIRFLAIFDVSLREGKKFVIFFISLFALALVVSATVVGVYYYNTQKQADQKAGGSGQVSEISQVQYSAGIAELMDCISKGTNGCSRFDKAIDYIGSVTPEGYTYSYTKDSQPGNNNGDGTKTVKHTSSLTPQQWQEIAQATSLDGRIQPGSITTENIKYSGNDTTTFELKDSKGTITGTMEVHISGSKATLKKYVVTAKN